MKYNLDTSNQIKIYYHLTSINNKIIIDQIFKQNKIDIVFHAAAYKHVDLAQENLNSLVNNNIFEQIQFWQLLKNIKLKNLFL